MQEINSIDRREAVKKMTKVMGIVVTAPMITSILNSCSISPELSWQPRSFSVEQINWLTSLAVFILPETTTPGAVSLGVPQFIDGMVTELMSEKNRWQFVTDFDALFLSCKYIIHKSFVDCSKDEKAAFLTEMESGNKMGRPSVWGTSMIKNPPVNFFWTIKDLIIAGYYLNEVVGERILTYDPVPDQYQACIPVEQVGRVWSL